MNTATMFDIPALPSHPAKYTDALLLTMAKMLQGRTRILDPFGGTGKVFLLEHWLRNAQIEAVEIEPEFASKHPRTTVGNALHLPWPDGYFDAVNTSPTYGNRMADKYSATDPSDRLTYAAMLQRQLHPDNSGAMQWGPKYKEFHYQAWKEARRVLVEGGVFVLNIKDHIRAGKVMQVTDWHILCLCDLNFRLVEHVKIDTPSMRYGRNGELRVPYESVIKFVLEGEMRQAITLTIQGERAPGWNEIMRMHWAEQQRRNMRVWLLVREAHGAEWYTLDYPVDIHVVATFKGTPLDSDNLCAKWFIDAIKTHRDKKTGTIDYRILREDDPKWVRRVTTESRHGKTNSVTITLTPVEGL